MGDCRIMGNLIIFTLRKQVTITVYENIDITRFSGGRDCMQIYRTDWAESSREITSKEPPCWERCPSPWKGPAGRREFHVMKSVRMSDILSHPSSGVRHRLPQQAFSVGSVVLCINIWYQARNSSNTDMGFLPHQWTAKPWVLLLELFGSTIQEEHATRSSVLKSAFPQKVLALMSHFSPA